MRRMLPPLNPLRAFEALARLGSVGAAAQELHVTHGAVSHQVKALEADLGIRLFNREKRSLRLTQAGAVYARQVRQALRLISESTLRLGAPSVEGRLSVSCAPTLASCWLVQELADFRRAFPEITLDIKPRNLDAAGLATEHYDLAIVYGNGDWEGRSVRLLTQIQMFPVCHPRFFGPSDQPRQLSDLAGRWLLHEDDGGNWKRWLAAVDIQTDDIERGTFLGGANLAIEAAAAGNGVAIGDDVVCNAHLRQGRLVRLFDTGVPAQGGYYLVGEHGREDDPRTLLFTDWLQERIRRIQARGTRLD